MSMVFSTNKSDRHDITEILLKVALNTINQTIFTVAICNSSETSEWISMNLSGILY
jgi:hypothetical protein